MRLVNTTGVAQGTQLLDADGNELDILMTDLNIQISVDEPIRANITCLMAPIDIEIPKENIHLFPADDLQEVYDFIVDDKITMALNHLRYLMAR